ncbi:hypothetical protein [Caldalkalibacillus salinus]|uniref:hypothetical protein n=1 Tax=Caldalkalibacillus salinus TaxID=2803787 RepID=UPI0019217DD8|nr:hypothetical protein [Caldalkalibacillus salinus]
MCYHNGCPQVAHTVQLKARGVFKNELDMTVKQDNDLYDLEKARKQVIDMDIDSLE